MNEKKTSEEERARELERAHEKIIGDESLGDVPRDGLGVLNLIKQVRNLTPLPHDSPADRREIGGDGETIGKAQDWTDGAELADPVSARTGDLTDIGRFKIKKQIGKGGFGVVFLAHDPNLGRDVALKIPRLEAVMTPDLKARFLREGRAAAALAHPNIVPVFEAGQIGAVCYLASQYVDGVTLFEWAKGVQVSPKEAAQISTSIAEALAHAHQRGILHRDIKPSNILVTNRNADDPVSARIQITDFGLAKDLAEDSAQTRTGEIIGSPSYMSPEQARQENATQASDVYSAGAVLYQLLTGRPPFIGNNVLETIQAVTNQEPAPPRKFNPSVPADLEAICLKSLEKKPEDRYQTGFELADDLRRWTRGEPVTARRVGLAVRLGRWYQRNTAIAVWVTATCLALVAGLVGTLLMYGQSQQNLLEAKRQTELAKSGLERSQSSIDTMLTDVAVSLASVPKMQGLRARLLEEALRLNQEILAEQKAQDGAADKTMESFSRMARLQLDLGKLEDALATIATGLEIFEELPAAEQESEHVIANWARLKRFDSQILRQTGNDEKSLVICQELIKKLESLNSNNFIVQIGLANSYRQSGIAHLNNGESQLGTKQFETAIAALDRIAEAPHPDVLEFTRAEVLNSLAIARKGARESDAAKMLYQKVIDIVDNLSLKFPERIEYRKMRNNVALNLGNLCYSTSDYTRAAKNYHSSLDGWQSLQIDFPDQPFFYEVEMRALQGLGITYAKLDEIEKSIEILERTVVASNAYEDRFGFSLSISNSRAAAYGSLGNRLMSIEKYDDARVAFENGLELHRSLAETFPQRLHFQTSVAVAIGNLGSLEQNIGNFEKALMLHQQSLDISLEMMESIESKKQFFDNINFQRGLIAEDHYMLRDNEQAFAAVRAITELAPEDSRQYVIAAKCLSGIVMHALANEDLNQAEKDELTDMYVKEAKKYLATAGELGADVDSLLSDEPMSVLKQ